MIERCRRIGIDRVLRNIAHSPEYKAQRNASPFFDYNASFDARATIAGHAKADITADANYLTNFLGVRIHRGSFPRFSEDVPVRSKRFRSRRIGTLTSQNGPRRFAR